MKLTAQERDQKKNMKITFNQQNESYDEEEDDDQDSKILEFKNLKRFY